MSVLILVAWLSSFLGSKWVPPLTDGETRRAWPNPLATFVRQNRASTIALLRTGLRSPGMTKEIRISLLQVQELPREQRRLVNKNVMASLMAVHKSMAMAQIWMKKNIEHSSVKVLLTDMNHTGSFIETIVDFLEDIMTTLRQFISGTGSKLLAMVKTVVGMTPRPGKWRYVAKNGVKILLHYLDFLKDSCLVAALIGMLSWSLFHSFGSFSSQVTWILVLSIVVPHVTSATAIAINHPTLVFGWQRYTQKYISNMNMVKPLLFIFGIFVPAILIYLKEEAKHRKKKLLKRTIRNFFLKFPELSTKVSLDKNEPVDDGDPTHEQKDQDLSRDLAQVTDYIKEVHAALLLVKRIELGTEVITQVSIQAIMMMVSQTISNTTNGLQNVFKEDFSRSTSVMGNYKILFLAFSLALSFRTVATSYLNVKTGLKRSFLFAPCKALLYFRAMLVSCTRVACLVAFFTPSLGLLNMLSHWTAEQPSLSPVTLPEVLEPGSRLAYWHRGTNSTQTVAVADIYRADYGGVIPPPSKIFEKYSEYYNNLTSFYSDLHNRVKPPPYTLYTNCTLYTFYCTLGALLTCQAIMLFLVKQRINSRFEGAGPWSQLQHLLESLTVPDCYKDWDEGEGGVEEHRGRWRRAAAEIAITSVIHFFCNVFLLTPVIFTGVVLQSNVPSDERVCFSHEHPGAAPDDRAGDRDVPRGEGCLPAVHPAVLGPARRPHGGRLAGRRAGLPLHGQAAPVDRHSQGKGASG